ncbi:MAG: MFS transporter [Candidatus Melainabacteria bacterium]|nr:MAG: MFS transporter [Candidatus Melainabacteria bacterium]
MTENLGASPLLFGLIWLAGPFTGMVVQPIVGALSDKTHTRFGRRRPYLLSGAILASIALIAFPNSQNIINGLFSSVGVAVPTFAALFLRL